MTEKRGLTSDEVLSPLNIEVIKKNIQRIKELADGLKTDKSLSKELTQRVLLLLINLGIPAVMVAFIVQPEIVVTAANTILHAINPQLEFYELLGANKRGDINKFLRGALIGASTGLVLNQQQSAPETRPMPALEMYGRVSLAKFRAALQTSQLPKNDSS